MSVGPLVLPEALRGLEPVRSIRAPARLEYTFTAGEATSRFLRGIASKRILGERCPVCGKVMLPPRGRAPPTASRPASRSSWPTGASSPPSAW